MVYKKCDAKGGFCKTMDERLGMDNGKGMCRLFVGDLKTLKERYVGVYYKKPRKDNGVLLNFCPWCGEPILPASTKAAKNVTA